jgi:hypothetical protein
MKDDDSVDYILSKHNFLCEDLKAKEVLRTTEFESLLLRAGG